MNEFTIPKPCSERFSAMSPTQKGAFCNGCATEVIDLRNANQDEIIQYFKQAATKKTCVNIHQNDLDIANTMNWYSTIPVRSKMKFMFMLALVLVFTTPASAVEKKQDISLTTTISKGKTLMGGLLIPMSDSLGYFPTEMDLIIDDKTLGQFVFTHKGKILDVTYEAEQDIVVTVTAAYEVPDDDTIYVYDQEVIFKDQYAVKKGEHHLEIPLGEDRDLPIYLTVRWNGGSRELVLYGKGQFEGFWGF